MKPVRYIALLGALACQPSRHQLDTTLVHPVMAGVVALRNGSNPIDLLGDATPAQAFVAWRGNFNAHGFSTVAVYLRAKADRGDSLPEWQIVPRFGGPNVPEAGREFFSTSEGAECTLGDLRLVPHFRSPIELGIGRRELGASFADSAATFFDYYKLSRNADGVPGWPPYYFAFVRTIAARRQYCDVNVAFDEELHLGRHGLGHGEASQ
jgi:hypothetical protein